MFEIRLKFKQENDLRSYSGLLFCTLATNLKSLDELTLPQLAPDIFVEETESSKFSLPAVQSKYEVKSGLSSKR